jgi:protein-S-isoprenylcysteine O-methyltransferase Ste14
MAGVLLVLSGLGLRSWAAGTLRKGQSLTTTGPYSLCRHPLYLGTGLLLTGGSVLVPALLPGLALAVAITWITMGREERRLAVKYGSAWKEYVARTPCVIPWRLPRMIAGEWRLRQWLRSREYNAVGASVLAAVALLVWHAVSQRLGGQ